MGIIFKRISPDDMVFISYCRDDLARARSINRILKEREVATWIDYEQLVPGDNWKMQIERAITKSRAVVLITSKRAYTRPGYYHQEVRYIIDKINQHPPGSIVVIVLRLDDYSPELRELNEIHWANAFGDDDSISAAIHDVVFSLFKNEEQREKWADARLAASREAEQRRQEDTTTSKSDQEKAAPAAIKSKTDSESRRVEPPGSLPKLFLPEELDIYVNKVSKDAYIFHNKVIDYDIKELILHTDGHWVIVAMNDGRKYDLGVNVQWLIRPYFSRAREVSIVRTRDGDSEDGVVVPLRLKGSKRPTKPMTHEESALRTKWFSKWINRIKGQHS